MDSHTIARSPGRPNADSEGRADSDAFAQSAERPTSMNVPINETEARHAEQVVYFVRPERVNSRYVLPYALARSYESVKGLVEEMYLPSQFIAQREALSKGEFEFWTETSAIILPSVWTEIVKPNTTIELVFREDIVRDHNGSERNHERPEDVNDAPSERPPSAQPLPVRFDEVEAVDVATGASESEQEDSTFTASTNSDSETEALVKQPEPERTVRSVTDSDGNKLTYGIDTLHFGPAKTGSNDDSSDAQIASMKSLEGTTETLRITKAMTVPTDNKTVIHVSTLPGPETTQLRDGVTMTWYHLQAKELNFARFRQACLDTSRHSHRLQILIGDILGKIEKRKVKTSLGGLYVEPGTVMRVDERCQPDPQSVIFSCIPYLDLQEPVLNKSADREYPPRTLMQSAYPNEPVRERDAEQAYRKYGNPRSKKLIYVPSLWMMNIGANVVVTCGHRPLAMELVKSLEVVEEDVHQLGIPDITEDTLTSIRLTDWNGQAHIYSLPECRTYFQMEQRLRELLRLALKSTDPAKLCILDGTRLVTSEAWPSIVRRTDRIFIDLTIVVSEEAERLQRDATAGSKVLPSSGVGDLVTTKQPDLRHRNHRSDERADPVADPPQKPSATALPSAKPSLEPASARSTMTAFVPPFFYWSTAELDSSQGPMPDSGASPVAGKHVLRLMQLTEKSMARATLDEHEATNEVASVFTTTSFFDALNEGTQDYVNAQFSSLASQPRLQDTTTYHATVVDGQCANIVGKSQLFCEMVQATVRLFVRNADESILLRKLWGAMANIHALVERIMDGTVEKWTRRQSRALPSQWYIRKRDQSQPTADKRFARSVKHCPRCIRPSPFESPADAIAHLRSHLRLHTQHSSLSDGSQEVAESNFTGPHLKDWVLDLDQLNRETTNAAALAILTQACDDSRTLYEQLKGLTDGVRKEDGSMSELYTFPYQLVETFRSIIVLYLAVERALHFKTKDFDDEIAHVYYASTMEGPLEDLRRFAKGVQRSTTIAHDELCDMVKTEASLGELENLSLGPQYVCSWLMRRLLVKPLDSHLAIAEMYREYLTMIQFQVNHRPGKRLIRAINLLQEELQVLVQVNSWQQHLIQRYSDVVNDKTYEKDLPARRAMFPHERILLQSCAEQLTSSRRELKELIRRCGPLSDSTKQSLEINEEDHGKAIMVFTIVTIIFLPLSFVTSFFGMNTADIRDMSSNQPLFWAVAIPLTAVTMGAALLIGYNGDELRDLIAHVYHTAIGKRDGSNLARRTGITGERGMTQIQSDNNNTSDITPADNAEYALPWAGDWMNRYDFPSLQDGRRVYYNNISAEEPRLHVGPRTARYVDEVYMPAARIRLSQPPPPPPYDNGAYVQMTDERYQPGRSEFGDEWYDRSRLQVPGPSRRSTRYDPEAGDLQEYTWHKKSRRTYRRGGNDYSGRRRGGLDVDRGGEVQGYGVEERRY